MNKRLIIAALLCVPIAHTAFGKCKRGVCRPKVRKVVAVKRSNPARTCVKGVCSAPKRVVKPAGRVVKAATPSCRSCKR